MTSEWTTMAGAGLHEWLHLEAEEDMFGAAPGEIRSGFPHAVADMLYGERRAKAGRPPEGTADKIISELQKSGGIKDLATRRPDVVFEMLTVVGRRDAERLLSEVHGQWMDPLLTLVGFSELTDRRPVVAIELLRRVLDRAGPGIGLPISRDTVRGLVRALIDPEVIVHFVSVRPAVLHQMLLVLERSGAEFIDSEVRGRWDGISQPGVVGALLSTNPEVAVALLRLLRVVHGDGVFGKLAEEVFKRNTDIKRLALQGYSPVYSELLQMVREVGGEQLLSSLAELLLEVCDSAGRRNALIERMPVGLAGELKRFAEAAGNARLLQVVVEGVAAVMRE